jgi:hypothetical protein
LLLKSDIAAFIRREAPFIPYGGGEGEDTGDDGTGTTNPAAALGEERL